jgi:hypothetical protein
MPAPALTKKQEAEIRARVRAGADIPALVAFAKAKEWKVGRAKLGQLFKAENDARAEIVAALPKPPAPEELAELVAQLQAEVASLRGRLEGLLHIPRVKLSDVANAAVDIARQMLADPKVDAAAKTKVMAQMPDLIDSARKALEAEHQGGDEDLGI